MWKKTTEDLVQPQVEVAVDGQGPDLAHLGDTEVLLLTLQCVDHTPGHPRDLGPGPEIAIKMLMLGVYCLVQVFG